MDPKFNRVRVFETDVRLSVSPFVGLTYRRPNWSSGEHIPRYILSVYIQSYILELSLEALHFVQIISLKIKIYFQYLTLPPVQNETILVMRDAL